MEIVYKQFVIEPAPYQLANSGKWTIQVYIRHDTGDVMKSKPFSADNTFDTQTEATENGIELAKQIIDGRYPACTVHDLL